MCLSHITLYTSVATLAISHLTHSCPEISMTSVVWTCGTFENNFKISHLLEKSF